jgi:hypothetical protein
MTNLVAAAAALSVIAAPAFAGPGNRAAKLSLAKPAPTPAKPAEGGKSHSGTYVLAGLGVAAIVVAAVALSKKDSKSASS